MALNTKQIYGSGGKFGRTGSTVPKTTTAPKPSYFEQINTTQMPVLGPGAAALGKDLVAANKALPKADFTGSKTNTFDLLQSLVTGSNTNGSFNNSGGGSGGSGGSGGYGVPAVDPALAPAFQAYIDSLSGTGTTDAIAKIREQLQNVYKAPTISDDPIHRRYAEYASGIEDAGRTGRARLSGIRDDLDARTAVTTKALAAASKAGLNNLNSLDSRFAEGAARDTSGLNNILSAFDAGSVGSVNAPVDALFDAARGRMSANQGLFAQSQADRSGLSENLRADVGLGMSQAEQALMAQLAAQRAAGLESNDRLRMTQEGEMARARAQAEAQLFIQEAQAKQQAAEAAAAARLEAARLGVKL